MLKLFKMLGKYKLPIALVLMLVFFQTIADLYLPTLMAAIVDKGIINGDIPYILKTGGLMLLITFGGIICAVIANFFSAKVAAGFGKNLRAKVFAHVENYSLSEFDEIGTASLITRTTNDINQIQQVLTMMLRMMLQAPLMCIGGILMAVSMDAKLSLIFIVIIPIIASVIFVIGKKGMILFQAVQSKLDQLNLVLREGLAGVRVIRAFNRTKYEERRFNMANFDFTDTALKVNKLMATVMPIMMLIFNFSIISIIWFGAIRIDNGKMQVGALMAFIQYGMQIMFSFITVSFIFVMIPRATVSAARINEVLEKVPKIEDGLQVQPVNDKKSYLQFQDVTFSYPGAEKSALANITFRACPGEITAIIGGTGSGKSTLISLIPRFYDLNQGKILLNGMNICDLTQESLRAKIGFVSQKAVLFTGTIAENIRYGKEKATDEEVMEAAKIAQATDFISQRQGGFDSIIAQGGANLSGGQKQRLAIARALIRKPAIYIFDDSFSALDFKTEASLRTALKQETAAAIVLIVAQRVTTVMDADQIIVLDEGQIIGIGNHLELMNTCEIYREIVSSQLAEEGSA